GRAGGDERRRLRVIREHHDPSALRFGRVDVSKTRCPASDHSEPFRSIERVLPKAHLEADDDRVGLGEALNESFKRLEFQHVAAPGKNASRRIAERRLAEEDLWTRDGDPHPMSATRAWSRGDYRA